MVPDLPLPIEDPAVWSARFVLAADGAEQRGLAFPWYMHRHKFIHEWHGGRVKVVELIVDLALALLNQNPDLDVQEAAFEAGNEFRQSIRGQWDYNSGAFAQFDVHIEWVEDRINSRSDAPVTDFGETRACAALGLVEYHPIDIEDPERRRIRLVREAIDEVLTPLQRAAVELRSGGMTYAAVADELGMASRTQAYGACKRAYERIKDYIEEKEQAA